MAVKTIKINGTDYTAYFTPVGYEVGHEMREGKNGGMMQDGSWTDDILARKSVLRLPLMPLSTTQVETLLRDIYGVSYPTVYFYDPYARAYRTASFRLPKSGSQRYLGEGTNSTEYWNGGTIQLTER